MMRMDNFLIEFRFGQQSVWSSANTLNLAKDRSELLRRRNFIARLGAASIFQLVSEDDLNTWDTFKLVAIEFDNTMITIESHDGHVAREYERLLSDIELDGQVYIYKLLEGKEQT